MVIYLDLVFLMNFVIDFMLLKLTATLSRRRVSHLRIAAGSLFGAGYTVLLFFPPLSFLYTFIIKFMFSLSMILIVFGYHRLLLLFKQLALFYFVSFIAGGGVFAAHYFLQSNVQILSGLIMTQTGGPVHPVTLGLLVTVLPLVYWLTRSSDRWIGRFKKSSHYMGRVTIHLNDQSVSCEGLVDTGNRLYEPMTRIPVMILEYGVIEGLLPRVIIQKINEPTMLTGGEDFFESLNDEWIRRIRLIPYRSVGNQLDFLIALRPDHVQIQLHQQIFETDQILIGLSAGKLASGGEYQAIIHPDMVTEKSKDFVTDAPIHKQSKEV